MVNFDDNRVLLRTGFEPPVERHTKPRAGEIAMEFSDVAAVPSKGGSNLEGEPIVQQLMQPCEALRRRALALLNHVDGEFEDEDGDCANGFILADPIPSTYIRSLFYVDQGAVSSKQGSSRKHKLENDYLESSDDWFLCNLCKKEVSLQNLALPVLTCSCLFCKPCLGLYGKSVVADSMKNESGEYLMNGGPVSSIRAKTSVDAAKCSRTSSSNFVDLTEDSGPFSSSSDYIPCPSPLCHGQFPLTDLQFLAPDSFLKWEEAASEALFQNSGSFVKCPGCQVVIEKVNCDLPPGLALSGVPEVDRTVPFTELDHEGRPLSRRAMLHKAVNRFRCVLCNLEFCGACLQSPYHLGKTCEQLQEERQAIRCIYCEEICRIPSKEVIRSVKDIRNSLERDGVDNGWCVEKTDLLAVQRLSDRVCREKECRKRLKEACTRNVHCGHHCGGVRGERHCLPCLEPGCQQSVSVKYLPSAAELCGICLVEPLRSAPSIQMKCGHIVHFHCAKRQVQEGFPGPQISFGYVKCPQCKELMQHTNLDIYMHKPLAMLEQIKAKALKRMKMEGLYDKLKSDGSSEEKIASSAMENYQYYMCSKCHAPYFGGKRNCRANLDQRRQYDPSDLVCGGCSAGSEGKCKHGHGKEYVEFKCRFCCSVATFFCFGSTHFCDECHMRRPDSHPNLITQCKGPRYCPLRIQHAPNGHEYCLGCSMCWSQEH